MYNRIDRRIILKIGLLTSSLVLLFCLNTVKAQGDPIPITTGSITASTFCPGRSVSVPFTADAPFDANNEFTAQISDATGSFSNPISIGTLNSTASSGTISARIPSNIPAGTGYRIRVVGSNPESIGTDNGTDLTIEGISSIGSATSNLNNICPNTSIALTANEVVIGEGAELIWYDGPVEGTPTEVGRSNPLTVSPSKTTTYFATLDGTCNYTEAFVTIIVGEGTPSSIGTVTSDIDNICPYMSVELTANEVTIGSGATLTWYDGPSGTGTALGNSNSLIVSPASTTTYYARIEGGCNVVEESVTVNVDGTGSSISSVTSDQDNICPNTSVELTAHDVTTCVGATLTWYDGPPNANGTVALGSSNPLTVAPSATTTYYVKLDGSCNVVEQSVTVTVEETESSILSVTSDINNTCPNTSVELTANEVITGSGGTLTWYDGPSGTGTALGNSNPLIVSPANTTTYYARIEGGCNVAEQSVTVIVDQTESAISSVTSSSNNISPDTNLELTANGVIIGTGATLTWYDGPEGTGTALGTSNPLMVSPAITTTYYARLEGSCNTVEESVTVTVDEEEEDVYNFPTAFTPNGDGVNDVWDVGENQIDPGAYVWIYDNNGQLVFKSIGYQKPWDGNYKGKPQPVGTYYYVIKLNGKKQKEGFVMILK